MAHANAVSQALLGRRIRRTGRVLAATAAFATLVLSCCTLVFTAPRLPIASSRRSRHLVRQVPVQLRATETTTDFMPLQDWLQSKDVLDTSKARIGSKPGFGLCLVAGDAGVKAGDSLMRIPSSLHISPSSVRASPVGKAVSEIVDDDSALLALGLLAEVARGEESPFASYLKILPGWHGMHLPLLWPDAEREELLRGSHLLLATQQLRESLVEQWASIEQVAKAQPDIFPPATFTERNWLWAHAVALTRALPFGNELSLIPGVDMCNHEKNNKNTLSIGIVSESGELEIVKEEAQLIQAKSDPEAVLTASRDHAPGEQIFIDYDGGVGFRLAWEMLYTYGFVPGEQLEEVLASGGKPLYFKGVQAGDPLLKQKCALYEALGGDPAVLQGMWHDVRPSVNECRAMAPLLRLAHLNVEDGGELAENLAKWQADPQETWQTLQKPLDKAVERKVAEQIKIACEEALEALPPAEELGQAAAPSKSGEDDTPEKLHARLAARVALGERVALDACMGVWRDV